MPRTRATPPPPEQDEVRHGDAVVRYTVRRSARRRKTIAISVGRAGVTVLSPIDIPAVELRGLVIRRAEWILRHAAGAPALPEPPPRPSYTGGETLPLLGADLVLDVTPGPGKRVTVEAAGDRLIVRVPASCPYGEARDEATHAAIVAWYRREAERVSLEAVARWSPRVGAAPPRVLIRDQKRRWGSCAPDGTIRINWRIAMLPPHLIDYVVVHELCHLLHRNHGPAFWAEVERHIPDAKAARRALLAAGRTLPLWT